jgi:nucleotide-binding universal stress UspA family protein
VILIGYDASADSRAAIREAAILMPGHPATILVACHPNEESAAAECAAEAEQLAHEIGLDATARVVGIDTSAARTILREAREAGSRAIVLGRGGGDSLVRRPSVGSVAAAVLRHAHCAVMLVTTQPSAPTSSAVFAAGARDA